MQTARDSPRAARRSPSGATGSRTTAPEAPTPTGADPAAAPPPLLQPGPRSLLLAAVVLAALVGMVGGGAGAWLIYQHFGPVERIVNQPVNGTPNSQSQTVGQLAQAKSASVVTIATQPVAPGSLVTGGAGQVNGVVVSADGLILTSAHAVQGASQLRVGLPDGRGFDADIVEVDTTHGLVLLRVPGATGLTPITVASGPPSDGDQAIAVSRPGTSGLSVGVGTVSSVGETLIIDTGSGAVVQDAMTIDATAESGADGAPVLDSAGGLIGIVVTVTQAPAPPGVTALSVSAIRSLINSASGGSAQPQGSFGADSSYLDPIHAAADQLTPGALIEAVAPGGPAAAAGLQRGDIVTRVDGIAIDATHPFDPTSLGLSPGDTATVTLVRQGTTQSLPITVGTAA